MARKEHVAVSMVISALDSEDEAAVAPANIQLREDEVSVDSAVNNLLRDFLFETSATAASRKLPVPCRPACAA